MLAAIQKILKYSKKIGAEEIYRPTKYATGKTTSEKSLIYSINILDKRNYYFDNVLFIQPTSPLRYKRDFDRAISKFNKNNLDSLFSANLTNDTNVWQVRNNKLKANYNYKKRKMRQDSKDSFLENGSFYIFNKSKFLDKKCRLFGNIDVYLMKKRNSFQIDDLEDIHIVNSIFNYEKYKFKKRISKSFRKK